jgi:outer membrane protein assembly factor BamB/ubiquinone/menaquinone biosynthesis C-methylase UbiE
LFLPSPLCARPAVPADQAGEILKVAGVQGGLIVHLGCGEGRLTVALRADDRYLVHGLADTPAQVGQARERIRAQGRYGPVSIDLRTGSRLPYADNLVNLVVAKDVGDVPMDEILRVLRPEGVAYVREGAAWKKIVKPRPETLDEWTHFLHGPDNNAVARDTVVGPPGHFQWICGPRWARSHDHLSTVSAVVSARGRLFFIVDEGLTATVALPPRWALVARDAFNGVLLWKRPIASWEGHLRDFRTGPSDLARRLVAVGDRVYVTLGYGEPVLALDAATGKTLRTYAQTKNALEIVHREGTLFLVVGDRAPDAGFGLEKSPKKEKIWHWWPIYGERPPKKHLVALRAESGDVLWKKDDADTVRLMPTTLAAAGDRVFFQNQKELLALDARTGKERWRAPRPVNRRRPTWSAPTLVVCGKVVLCADRAVDAPPPGVEPSAEPDQWVVNSLGGVAPQGQIVAFSAETGARMWESEARECYNAPVDLFVIGDKVWSGNLVRSRDPGITVARDLRTGKVVQQRPKDQQFFRIVMGHHRCYRNKATLKYLVLGRDGTEFIDVATGKGVGNAWVRGACQYGVVPCNGLLYAPSHSCACHIESKLNGFNALASTRSAPAPDDAPRLRKGPAYGTTGKPAAPGDWPTYRHDAQRSGKGSCSVPSSLKRAWKTGLPGERLSSLVVAGGRVWVASIDTHSVCALDAESGELQWRFVAGGRIDSPPTIQGGMAVFGCADGWIYCLRAADGALAWRFRAAPEERRIVSYGRLESAWPLHGSVLVRDGVAHAVCGRSSHLDGGMRLCQVDVATGRLISDKPVPAPALPDVLSGDGESLFLRHQRFDEKGDSQKGAVPHLYSPAGFLDDSWWHRTYWQFGTTMRSAWGGWPVVGNQVPSGRLLVVDGETVYGFGRLNQYHRDGTHVGLGDRRYFLFGMSRKPGPPGAAKGKGKGKAPAPKRATLWSQPVPLMVRGMVLGGEVLFVAGPPDLLAYPSAKGGHPYDVTSVKALHDQEEAFLGKRGGSLWAVATADGRKLASYPLASPPVWDSLVAANGRLYLGTLAGDVLCYAGK